jgi:uncharacterized protein YjiS (DUF1127 family)
MTELALVVSKSLWSSFISFFEKITAQYEEERSIRAERARIVNELNAATDRQLADMGFNRTDIPAIANGTYQR